MIPEDIQSMLDKICRSCMCEREEMNNIFEKNGGETMLLSDMLMACTSLVIVSGDGLPNLLCNICQNKLSSAFEFKQQCEKSDTALREVTQKNEHHQKIDIIVQQAVYNDDEDDVPLLRRKRGRPLKSEMSLQCKYCLRVMQSKKALETHLRHHAGDGMRYCPICPLKYSRTNHLVRHMKKHDKEGLKHQCPFCSEKFAITGELFKHKQSHLEYVEGQSCSKYSEKHKSSVKVEIKEEQNADIENFGTNHTSTGENASDVPDDKDEKSQGDADGDSMDVPLNQFPFSDGEDDDGNFEFDNEDYNELENKAEGNNMSKANDAVSFECKECNKVMNSYTGLRIHMRKHNGSDLANCKLCDKLFTKKSHLNRHLRTHGVISAKLSKIKGDKKVMECEFCDRKFKYRKSFSHHMRVEHGMSDNDSDLDDTKDNNEQADNVLSNNNGGAVKEDRDQADVDQQATYEFAEPNVPKAEQVDNDEEKFVIENNIDREDASKKSKKTRVHTCHVCLVCNKQFSRGEHLIRHLKLHQSTSDETQLKCSICEAVFPRSDHLARHTKAHLMQDKRHVCIECGKAFNRLDNLKTHQRIHSGIKDTSKLHLCVYCGKEFNNSSNMIVHMRRHTGERPYKCGECGKGFPRSHDLKCHERTHSGEKPYLCTLCGKSFNKSNKLLRHSRVHTGERPYVCNICGRAFTQSNDLALHMRRHTGARPYACGVCPARFIQSGQLKNHRRTTGHWMETQPDLKGGHRVEPVTSAAEPMPIKFKTFGKPKAERDAEDIQKSGLSQSQSGNQDQVPPQRILMGIMGNIKLPNEMQSIIIDNGKIVDLQGTSLGLVTLPSVIEGSNGEEVKLKTEIGGFNIAHVEEDPDKHEVMSTTSTYHEGSDSVSYSTVPTSTTYSEAETFAFQTFH
ncbi:zinc finger protein 84-like isoform X2 [Cylas formicarius]|uniref:zinc finger protein 84-like isoform X2 n=1 Tax=Cylas formicarius TaxID=197179 RepID=UPI0029586EC8|nr:zinc finger protein 84-like isoform X2 [Cylas formicarius]